LGLQSSAEGFKVL
jgi:hypothetical protein